LALSSPAPSIPWSIDARCRRRIKADQRVIVVRTAIAPSWSPKAYASVFLMVADLAQQTEWGGRSPRSVRTIWRYRKRCAHRGMAGLGQQVRTQTCPLLLRRMSTQEALALPSPAPSNTVVINARCSLRIEADQRVIVVAGLAFPGSPVERSTAVDDPLAP
jgi:hypothetical protein